MKNKAIIALIIVVVLVGFLATIFLMGDSGIDGFSIKSNEKLLRKDPLYKPLLDSLKNRE